ncbi:hypothetical protein [Phyllobacterium sp. P30BS-XVII]|uniref:hypothetical protein n=1 Tax=Phyllobacterium sp. P30BS-XVII TaxID=2587046 RepID=UPI00185DEDC4|nr:hypothetical protein [Phyllobacterium sp. P30BS-XVII]MBA8904154.1 hypothetical protein [Phyllobacterium sp. P30BS-XVII]
MKILGSGFLASIGAAGILLTVNTSARAADASWGCQVLLCAASETPSWHGVPYCVPPMTKLIAAMKLPGFSWPICKEGNAGKPGLEPYEPCPAGWTATGSSSTSEHGSSSQQNVCTRSLGRCNSKATRDLVRNSGVGIETQEVYAESGHNGSSCEVIQTQPRKLRAKPYFFDIPNIKGVKQRFWFDLNK